MARSRSTNKPHLVEVPEVPRASRRSVYTDLVEEFAKSKMGTAKVEGVKPAAAVSVRKAIAKTGVKNVKVVTAQGGVYLVKSD